MKLYGFLKKITGKVQKYGEENFKYIFIMFLIIVLTYSGCFTYNTIQDGDEFATIGFPAYLAGKDWSNIISGMAKWHGYGHVWYLFPFLKLCNSAVAFYNVFRINCLVTWVFLAILIFHMSTKLLRLSGCSSTIVALVCTLGNLKPDYGLGLSVMTELPTGVIHVVISFMLIKSMQAVKDKNKRVLSFFLGFLCSYTLSIHSRAIVLILSVFISIVISYVLWKSVIADVRSMMLGGILGGIVYKLMDGFYRKYVFISGEMANIPSHVYESGYERIINIFQDAKNIQEVFNVFFSLVSGFVILSFGLLTFFLVIICQYWFKKYKEPLKKCDIIMVLSLHGVISWIMMNIFIALREYTAVQTGDKRWYVYLRYAIPFVIIIVFCGSVILIKREITKIHRAVVVSTVVNCLIVKFFLGHTLSLVGKYNLMNRLANIFRLFFYRGETNEAYFSKIILLGAIIWFVVIILIHNKKEKSALILYTVVSIIFTFSAIKCKYDYSNETEYYITNASNQIIEVIDDDVDIYCHQTQNFVRYLVIGNINVNLKYLEDVKMLEKEKALVLSNDKKYEVEDEKIFHLQLDENEYLYTKDETLFGYICGIWK